MLDVFREDPSLWFFITVAGVAITTVGTLIAGFVKDFLQVRWLEQYRERKALNKVYLRYRDPIVLSARELSHRLLEIINDFPPAWLKESYLDAVAPRLQSDDANDPHFKSYKQISTLYRFCSFFAWLEIYRQEVVFLNPGHTKKGKVLQRKIEATRAALSEGGLNKAHDADYWSDVLVFREELRALGESMVEKNGTEKQVIGYAAFCSNLKSSSNCNYWVREILPLFLCVSQEKNFRLVRFQLLSLKLIELIESMDAAQVTEVLSSNRPKLLAATRPLFEGAGVG